MNGPDSSFPAEEGEPVPVGEFDSLAEADEYMLVVLAMGRECSILELPGAPRRFLILAGRAHADAIREEFAAYAAERAEAAETSPAPPVFRAGLEVALLWVLALFVLFHFQCQDPAVTERFSNSSRALFDRGQWWRPFSALFLHADVEHLLGNLVYGLVFFPLVAYSLGAWRGWLLILASGAAGNTLAAWVRYPAASSSLGASTATLGAMGILTGLSVLQARRERSCRKLGGVIVPVGAGAVLLGWLGAGEAPADVLGHLLGFLAGCVAGLIGGLFRASRR